jgi:hypothetical protein
MPLDKITVSRTFHLGDSNFLKVGQEGTISEGETREELTADAMKYIYSTLKKYCPDEDIVIPTEIKKEIKEISVEPIIGVTPQDIYSCTEIEVLKGYQFIVKSKPELQKAYDEQFKKLCK